MVKESENDLILADSEFNLLYVKTSGGPIMDDCYNLVAMVSNTRSIYYVDNTNYMTSVKGFDDYWGFYAPSGWASMHLYGNPDIRFV